MPKSPAQLAEQMIREKWGVAIDPQTAQLVTLHYDYWLRPEPDGSHKGRVASSRSLVQALLSDYQTVGDGRFGETAFGLYTPPDVGPAVHLMEGPEPTDDHRTYEGIYRQAVPQTYGPQTQIKLRPADFKQWVWTLFFDEVYQAYVDKSWPSDEVVLAADAYPLRTSTKAAFVMTAWLQFHELCLSRKGLALAMQAAGLASDQRWDQLTMAQLQAPTRLSPEIEASRLEIYRYTATDIWCFQDHNSGRMLMYIPGNSSPLHEFDDAEKLRQWIAGQGRSTETRQALASHFAEEDRHDGTFHAGVHTALEGMAQYPDQHRLSREAGFFNNDGYWNPAEYIGFDLAHAQTDPFAQLVLTMKQTAQASVKTIRNDAQVNRDNLSAAIEPVVQWINRFGPLALFVPGGEGVLALAGLIDAGYGLEQAIDGETADQRSQGAVRTVFGLLNALPLVAEAASIGRDGAEAGELITAPVADTKPGLPPLSRIDLLRGVGAPAGTFSDEVLAQIGTVSAVDDDMLRLIQAGRAPTPLLADTIERFRIDQEAANLGESPADLFNSQYQALQHTEHAWVRMFQRQYPDLPTSVVEQMLDRHGIDFTAPPEAAQARQLFKQLDAKARQYQQHLRLNRAYEGLYLRSVINRDSDTLALHSLENLPGWPTHVRFEVLDGTQGERLLDRIGPLDTPDCRRLIKTHNLYRPYSFSSQAGSHFYDAIAGVLSEDERSALHLPSKDPGSELRFKTGKHPLPRPELALGLGRMDSGLSFEAHGLRGGGFPQTPQGPALTHATMKIQVREIYPDFSSDEADALLQQLGDGAQAYLNSARQRLFQLYVDLDAWVDQVATDIDDMDIQLLHMGDPGAQGFTEAQLRQWNAQRVQETMDYERETRHELRDELIAIMQKRVPQQRNHFSGDAVVGYTIDLSNDEFHRLPVMHARLNGVVGMNVQNFHLFERETLNPFLESFPNLRTLNLEGTDLRILDAQGEFQSALPSTIPRLQHLVSLNLRATRLTFREDTAAQFTQLVNLQTLDLSENPLLVPPVVLGMDQLKVLKLNDTDIAKCPVGIREQPSMTTLDLRNNRIRRVPQAILNQAVTRDRVLLWNNPLTDEDTLQQLVWHREQTGINLWLSTPRENYADPQAWLNGIETGQRNDRLQIWHRLALKPRGGRFLGAMNTLTLTADFQVNYLDLQARVWRLLARADASQELWEWLNQRASVPGGNFDNPYAVFAALEDRARLFNEQAG
ncbi:leucine-rich repeat domain-containing protein [Pseudomonas sp. SDO55104_S430]